MLVVDASAVVEALLDTETGSRVLDACARHTLHAPDLIGLEVVSVLRRAVMSTELARGEAVEAVQRFLAIGIETYDHAPLLARCLELADNLTPYDAAYVALGEGLQAPILTCDRRLANAAGTRASFLVVS